MSEDYCELIDKIINKLPFIQFQKLPFYVGDTFYIEQEKDLEELDNFRSIDSYDRNIFIINEKLYFQRYTGYSYPYMNGKINKKKSFDNVTFLFELKKINEDLFFDKSSLASQILTLVVLLSDDYLKCKKINNKENFLKFFNIQVKLPLELQTMIANYIVGYNKDIITIKKFECSLRTLLYSDLFE